MAVMGWVAEIQLLASGLFFGPIIGQVMCKLDSTSLLME